MARMLTKTEARMRRFVVTMVNGTDHTVVALNESDAREFIAECYPNSLIATVDNLGPAYPWAE